MNRTRSAALRGGLSFLFCLFALLAAASLAAKPIPLSQPLDLSGKRVLIVPMLGRDAGSYSMGRMIFFPNEERRLANVASIDADTVAAREVEARLDGLGVDAQVLQIEYDDVDIYGDRETSFFNSQMPRRWKIEAVARQLLHERKPDAVLMLARGQVGVDVMNNNRPPALGYGVILSRKYSSAYASMLQVLYISGLDRPLVTRIGNATLPLPDTVAEKDLEFPPAETWAKAKPLIDDLLGRVARSLAAEVYDRARRPPKSATSGWRSVYPREERVSRPN